MSLFKKPAPSEDSAVWTVFCSAIDNYGDIGVCWRLARQLNREHGITVELWIDDWQALARFFSDPSLELKCCHIEQGIRLSHWETPWPQGIELTQRIASSAVVIEAFACTLPQPVLKAMAQSKKPPLWLNLEYLSAESWVRDCHMLPSLQSVKDGNGNAVTLQKYFFFPGFVEGTGGLLREADLLARHVAIQSAGSARRNAYLAPYGLPKQLLADPNCLFLSLFSYEGLPVQSLLAALTESPESCLCLVPEGRSLQSVQAFFGLDELPKQGTIISRASLTLVVLPFSSQDDYDELLSLCDFNIVRGEDSFVRAQFAAKPMLWHLYPQEEDAQLLKLEAFLSLNSEQSEPEAVLHALWRRWNQGEDCRELWHHLRPQLPALHLQARNWQQKLAQRPDLAANLLQFYRASCE